MTLCEAMQQLEIHESRKQHHHHHHRCQDQQPSLGHLQTCEGGHLPAASPMSGLIDLYKRNLVAYQLTDARDDWFYDGRPSPRGAVDELSQKDPELLSEQIMERIDYYLETLQEYCKSDDETVAVAEKTGSDLIKTFSAKCPPRISVSDYLERFRHYCHCDESQIIAALFQLTKLVFSEHKLRLNKLNIHRFLMASLVTTLKYNSDFYLTNKAMTRVSGIKLEEINKLEHHFLSLIDFKLYTAEDEFNAFSALFLDTYRKIQWSVQGELFGHDP